MRLGLDGVLTACTAVLLRLTLAVFAEGQACPDRRLRWRKTETENIVGLLDKPQQGQWTALTVGMSMRETENEINLLLPRQSLADISAAEGPAWAFTAPGEEPEDEDIPVTDELGESA